MDNKQDKYVKDGILDLGMLISNQVQESLLNLKNGEKPMTKSEIELLKSLLDEFENAFMDISQTETLYDLINRASVLYGSNIPEIKEQYEEIRQFHGLLNRNSKAIYSLLKKFYICQINNFEAGIMPITYENLAICPEAQSVYKEAITKYSEKKYERNILDDLRLALEYLVKKILGNDKPLEKQRDDLKNKLLSAYHPELVSMVCKDIEYFTTYQNRYVKHHDQVNVSEMDYIIEQTSAIINFLIKTLKV